MILFKLWLTMFGVTVTSLYVAAIALGEGWDRTADVATRVLCASAVATVLGAFIALWML